MKGIECIELRKFITEYKQKNEKNEFKPVAVGKYGIRTRESIYSKELAKDYSKNKIIFKNTLTVGMGSRQIDIGIPVSYTHLLDRSFASAIHKRCYIKNFPRVL